MRAGREEGRAGREEGRGKQRRRKGREGGSKGREGGRGKQRRRGRSRGERRTVKMRDLTHTREHGLSEKYFHN